MSPLDFRKIYYEEIGNEKEKPLNFSGFFVSSVQDNFNPHANSKGEENHEEAQ